MLWWLYEPVHQQAWYWPPKQEYSSILLQHFIIYKHRLGYTQLFLLTHTSFYNLLEKYLLPQPVFKTWDSKCLALINQMVRAFGMNPKVGGSSPPRVKTFSVSKTLTLSQGHPSVCKTWMLLPVYSWHSQCWIYFKNKIPLHQMPPHCPRFPEHCTKSDQG